MKIPSVRGAVGIGLSIVYHRSFEDLEFKRPYGLSRDMQHVSMACGAADVFVTEDWELSKLLRRVPLTRLRVVRLRQFIDELGY